MNESTMQTQTAELPILRVTGLQKGFRTGAERLEILRGLDLEVRRGEILAIVGQSGSGKSTLLHQVGLLDQPDAGVVFFRGTRLTLHGPLAARFRNRHFGFVFQFYHLLPEFTALENVLMPSMILDGWATWRRRKGEWKERARALLDRMHLSHRLDHKPGELSGGERQRVAIARALMNRPELLLCDEPTGNLDRQTAEEVRELLWSVNRDDGQTMIVVTHDRGIAKHADRTLELVDGRLVAL